MRFIKFARFYFLSTIRKFGALRLKLNYDERRFQFP